MKLEPIKELSIVNGVALRPLALSVKRRTWRMSDAHTSDRDKAFKPTKDKILLRDNYTCQYCTFHSAPNKNGATGLEVDHLDDDHTNNVDRNLVTACSYCHMVHHIGYAGMTNKAVLIYLPEIPQYYLSHLARALLIATTTEDSPYEASAKSLQAALESRSLYLEEVIGLGSSDPFIFGQAVIDAGMDKVNKKTMAGIRLLPLITPNEVLARTLINSGFKDCSVPLWEGLASGFSIGEAIRAQMGGASNPDTQEQSGNDFIDELSTDPVQIADQTDFMGESNNGVNQGAPVDDGFFTSADFISLASNSQEKPAVESSALTETADTVNDIPDFGEPSQATTEVMPEAEGVSDLTMAETATTDSYDFASVISESDIVTTDAKQEVVAAVEVQTESVIETAVEAETQIEVEAHIEVAQTETHPHVANDELTAEMATDAQMPWTAESQEETTSVFSNTIESALPNADVEQTGSVDALFAEANESSIEQIIDEAPQSEVFDLTSLETPAAEVVETAEVVEAMTEESPEYNDTISVITDNSLDIPGSNWTASDEKISQTVTPENEQAVDSIEKESILEGRVEAEKSSEPEFDAMAFLDGIADIRSKEHVLDLNTPMHDEEQEAQQADEARPEETESLYPDEETIAAIDLSVFNVSATDEEDEDGRP